MFERGGVGGAVFDAGGVRDALAGQEGGDVPGVRVLGEPEGVLQGAVAPVLEFRARAAALQAHAVAAARQEDGLRDDAEILGYRGVAGGGGGAERLLRRAHAILVPEPDHGGRVRPDAVMAGAAERAPDRQLQFHRGAAAVLRHVGKVLLAVHAEAAADDPVGMGGAHGEPLDAVAGLDEVRLRGEAAAQGCEAGGQRHLGGPDGGVRAGVWQGCGAARPGFPSRGAFAQG